MYIKKYDLYIRNDVDYSLSNKNTGNSNLYYITIFLLWRFNYVKKETIANFIEKNKEGIFFEEVGISIDQKNNSVYFIESYYSYNEKPTTLEIDELFEQENFIELCKIGFLDYIVMTKDNYIHILIAWNKILDELPPFVLLYQDDNNWFDVISFESQELMQKFIVDHTKIVLSKDDKQLITFYKFPESVEQKSQLIMSIIIARQMYYSFKKIFGTGSKQIQYNNSNDLFYAPISTEELTASLVFYHFAIELSLKSLLNFKKGFLTKNDMKNNKGHFHDLYYLFQKTFDYYHANFPEINKLNDIPEYYLLLKELGENAVNIRYGRLCIGIRPNIEPSKKPLEELSDALDYIYNTLDNIIKISTGI